MSNEIPNRLLAAASIVERAIVAQSGFIGNPGDSIVVTGTTIQLVFSPDTRIDPERLLVVVTPRQVGAANVFLGFGANNDRLVWNWLGTEAPDEGDFDLLVYQLPNGAVNP